METSVQFNPVEYDTLSEIPCLHLSYIIRALLPIRLIGWKVTKRHYESIKATLKVHETESGDVLEFILVGSLAEGYGVPGTIFKSNPPRIDNYSDIDALFVGRDFVISSVKDFDKTVSKGFCDWEHTKPGYTRVCLPSVKELDEVFIFDEERQLYHLSSLHYQEKQLSGLSGIDIGQDRSLDVHGPAVSVEYQEKATIDNFKEKNAGFAFDIVTALPCKPWPEVAEGWRARALKSSWLDKSFIESIIKDGCHIVAVPHKQSQNAEIEWRLSFSASEGRLGREAVDDYQRQCFIFLKILRHQVMKKGSNNEPILSSYVFKSVFLHCCETLSVDIWKDNQGYCVLYMIDVILECLRKKSVPSYFLPENNLVGHLSEVELQEAEQDLEKLRRDPVTPILEFMDNRLMGLQPASLDFRSIIDRLLIDMKAFKQHRNIAKSVNDGIFMSAFTMCLLLLSEETELREAELAKHKEAVNCMIDIFPLMQRYLYPQITLKDFMNLIVLNIPDLKRCVRFYGAAIEMADEYVEFKSLRGNYACMSHAFAYTFPGNSTDRKNALKKAECVFKSLHTEGIKNSCIDYVTFLVKHSKHLDAIPVLEDFIHDEPNSKHLSNSYSKLEIETLDNVLRIEVETQGKFSASGLAFAFYYLVVCLYVTKASDSKISEVLQKFESYCSSSETGSSYALLGHAYHLIGNQSDSDLAFAMCISLWPEYKMVT